MGGKRKLLGPQIEEQILKYIKDNGLNVDDKIPNEFALASLFDVGRSTVREAVKGLESRGYLEVRRGSGTYIRSLVEAEDDPLGLSQLDDDRYRLGLELFEVRLMIEPEIASKAARNATDENIAEIRRLCQDVENLYNAGENHMKKDIEFHTAIAHASGNRVVEQLVPIINSSIETFIQLTHGSLKEETIQTHRAITESIAEHDSTGARCAMITHLTFNRQELIRERKKYQKEVQ